MPIILSRKGGDGGGSSSDEFDYVNVFEYGAVGNGVADDTAAIQDALDSIGTGTVFARGTFSISSPLIIPNGVRFLGTGSMQGGTTIVPAASFPQTTVDGAQSTAADTVTTFTLNVASTDGFPLGSGGIIPENGEGVLAVDSDLGYPVTIFYSGTTATSFTGCRVGASDVNAGISNTDPIGTFAVWLCDPALALGGFGTRLECVGMDLNDVEAISGIHSSHIQEGGGVNDVRITKFKIFGIRIDSWPGDTGAGQAVNYEMSKLWIISSSTPVTNRIGIDEMHSFVGTHSALLDANRGLRDVTFTTQGSATATGYAGLRVNASTGSYTDIHFECQNIGMLIGDVYPCAVIAENIQVGGTWGVVATGSAVEIGNTTGNSALLRNIGKSGNQPALVVVRDLVSSLLVSDNTVSSYELQPSGVSILNAGGGQYPFLPTAELIQDNVADGARDNVNSNQLTVTFTATTSIGDLAVLATASSGNMILTGVVDSRGNAWQVDVTDSAVGVTANIASSSITIAHQIGDTLTLTFSGASTYAVGIVSEFTVIETVNWLDQTQSNNGATGDGSTGATGTRTQAKELLFGAVGYANATSKTAGGSFTALTEKNSGAGNRKIFPIYQVVSQVGTTPATWYGEVGAWDAVIATYKVGSGANLILHGDGTWSP